MSELQNKTVTMELNNLQLETIKCLFGHNDWEMKIIEQSAVVEENGGNSHVQNNNDQSTQTNNDNIANEADEGDNPEFVIPPDTSQEECQYCFCRPCITNEQNKQMWWHDRAEAPHQRNSGLRKEYYKRFWTMLLHRGAWNDDRYLLMKTDALARDHRTQRFDWHRRDIMPKCVVTLVRHWFPNPGGFPYMGHMWE